MPTQHSRVATYEPSTAVFLVLFIYLVSWYLSCVVRLHRRGLDLTLALETDCQHLLWGPG